MSTTTDRPPVRARSGRRPLPPIIFLLVLVLAAVGVWWKVFRQDDDARRAAAVAAACAGATAAPPSLDPHTVTVHVLNATDQKGLASTVADELKARGFTVGPPDNDRSGRSVTGVGELRFGPGGKKAAAYLSAYVPEATTYQDTRATGVVDLVVGPDFKQLASAEQVAAAIQPDGQSACD